MPEKEEKRWAWSGKDTAREQARAMRETWQMSHKGCTELRIETHLGKVLYLFLSNVIEKRKGNLHDGEQWTVLEGLAASRPLAENQHGLVLG